MPRRKSASEGTLHKDQLIKAIRMHEEVEAVGGLTKEQVRAVLRAFADVVWIACLNNLTVTFENLGFFESYKKDGFKGGYRHVVNRFAGEAMSGYYPPKPPCRSLRFRLNKTANKYFKELTEEKQEVVEDETEV